MTSEEELEARYGRGERARRRRRVFLWGAGVVGAIAVVALAWITISVTSTNVRADDTAMTVIDERTVEVHFQVSGPADREIACALEALDVEFGVVGWKVVVLPPSGEHTRAFTERIATVAPATTGLVNSCWVT